MSTRQANIVPHVKVSSPFFIFDLV